jgi:hypothetical protein
MTPRAIFNVALIGVLVTVAVVKYQEASVSPNPGPEPGPTPSGKLWTCIVEETAERSKLPPAQVAALTSGDVRDYLNSHSDREGAAPTWRIFDKDQDVSNESQVWQDEFAVMRAEPTPSISIKSGRRWTKPQPLPKDSDSLLKLLKKYGGA